MVKGFKYFFRHTGKQSPEKWRRKIIEIYGYVLTAENVSNIHVKLVYYNLPIS
jgi:hypothetical protein